MAVQNLITCEVDNIQYLLHPQILGSTEAPIKADQVIPVLLLTEEELNGTPEQIYDLLKYYVDTDDVCSQSFTDILVEKPSRASKGGAIVINKRGKIKATVEVGVGAGLEAGAEDGGDGADDGADDGDGNDDDDENDDDHQEKDLPSGPYFLSGPNLHRAYRLYPDTQDAFVHGIIPSNIYDPSEGFKAVSFLAKDGMFKTIPVPSQHYTRFPSPGKRKRALAGKRVAITDGLEVKGTKTTLSCRAYVDTYPPFTTTDTYVQRLVEEGAVLVGKTKTSQLRIGCSTWPETHFPLNPRWARRGNMFDVTGSGIGSASALAGYEWLEGVLGVMVIDSAVRESGKRYGLFGLRRSINTGHDEEASEGGYGNVGIFARSLKELALISQNTFPSSDGSGKESSRNTTVKKILYLDYPKDDNKLDYAMEIFVNALEQHLGVERTTINLDEEWKKYQEKKGLNWALWQTATLLYEIDHYHEYAQFRRDYQEAHPQSNRALYDLDAQVPWSSAREHEDYQKELLNQLKIFRNWFEKDILESNGDDTIIVLPDISFHQGHIIGFFGRMLAFEDLISPNISKPQVSVPFTQKSGEFVGDYQSYSPIVASVIGPGMSDTSLTSPLSQALTASGLPTSVLPGPRCFPLPDDGAVATTDITKTTRLLNEMWTSSEDEFASLKQRNARGGEDEELDGETLAKSSLNIEVNLQELKLDNEE
ncbi:amidase signature domain-containing protein [Sordaria brevicollis]|uniref:Amidase signature domain-containing protein n=1 Tax=Sordaria brevicollis TaxID=83679 RepID=A0AAE0P214_SORBR|nr:amidase signature domain-containing protein [Sordaria brevicollis]